MSYLVSVKKITELFYLLINFKSRQGHAGVTYERDLCSNLKINYMQRSCLLFVQCGFVCERVRCDLRFLKMAHFHGQRTKLNFVLNSEKSFAITCEIY